MRPRCRRPAHRPRRGGRARSTTCSGRTVGRRSTTCCRPTAASATCSARDGQLLARCIEPTGRPGAQDIRNGAATDEIAQISSLVQRLRDLRYDTQPTPTFLDDAATGRRLAKEVRDEYRPKDADIDQRILAALGAVPPGSDLIGLQTDLLTSQVAGFYDPDNGELVVRGDADDGLDPTAQATLAHELEHALADQALELPVDTTEDVADSDAALAALSLIEGDATLTQQQFVVVGMTIREQLGLTTDPDALAAQEQLADVPHYLAQSLQFPYLAGLRFVCDRYLDGGWAAVDAAYDDLPTSSAEILDPARYGTAPVDPRDPGEPGGDWQRAPHHHARRRRPVVAVRGARGRHRSGARPAPRAGAGLDRRRADHLDRR